MGKEEEDYGLIDAARASRDEASEDWKDFEDVFRNLVDERASAMAKRYGRIYSQTPIAHDTVQIKRSLFSSAFQSATVPLSIEGYSEKGEEVARQLSLASKIAWKRSKPFVEVNKAMLRMLVFPVAVLACYWDRKKQRIQVNEVNPMDISFDPGAAGPDDVQYYVYDRHMTKGDVRSLCEKRGKKKKPWFNKIKKIEDVFEDYDKDTFQRYERVQLTELYTLEQNGKWRCRTYMEETKTLLHEQVFDTSPFSWGFALDKISSVDTDTREEEVLVYGQSEIENLTPYVRDMIQRKNQHADIIEKQINPDVFVPTNSGIKASMLKKGSGNYIPIKNGVEKIQFRPSPTVTGVVDSLVMAKGEVEDTSAINGFYKAQTSASDRRSTGAIALLESKASTRIEMQILTAKETLFNHFAKNYVELVYRHTTPSTMKMLDVEEIMIGTGKQSKPPLREMVSVEFGVDTDKDRRYAAYMEAAQVLGQYKDIDPSEAQSLVKEALKIRVGDRHRVPEDLFVPLVQEDPPPMPPTDPSGEMGQSMTGGADVIGGL